MSVPDHLYVAHGAASSARPLFWTGIMYLWRIIPITMIDSKRLTIISGIGPDSSGTGILMGGLIQDALANASTQFVFRRPRRRDLINYTKYVLSRTMFPWFVGRAARNEGEVVIFHPQKLGLALLRKVIEARKRTWMYVLDSSSFCVRSYNCLPAESAPCLRCLGNDGEAALLHGCQDEFRSGPFQNHLPSWVRSGQLRLIAQCDSQAKILRMHFGQETTVAVVPLSVPEIMPPLNDAVRPARLRPLAVFHGAPNHAKGAAHVIALAKRMQDWDFLVPASANEFKAGLGCPELNLPNLFLKKMSWASGLANEVQLADVVLCPPSWSAPVEGAVLKSLAHNGVVGLYLHETSFAFEIPPEARFSIDPGDLDETAERLRRLVRDPSALQTMRNAARIFISDYERKSRSMLQSLHLACGVD